MRLLLACTAALLLSGCGWFGHRGAQQPQQPTPTPTIPAPVETPAALPARRGLQFGYFGSDDAQVSETADHVTFLMPAWSDDASQIARALAANMPVCLVVEDALFAPGVPSRYLGNALADALLRAKFDAWRAAGALQLVRYLYVCDEPERDKKLTDADMRAAIITLRGVMGEFPELAAARLWVIFGDQESYPAIDLLDDVGCDAYGAGADILTGQYQRLKPYLRPDQGLILVPGGASPWRQDPRPFLDYANADPQVVAMVPFIWLDQWGGTTNRGIRGNGMRGVYSDVGQAIKAAT